MKRIVSLLLAVIVAAALLTACGQKTEELSRIDTGSVKHVVITVTDPDDGENTYDIIRRKGVVQLVEIHNTARFVETDETTADKLKENTLYSFRYYDYSEKLIGECSFSPEGFIFKGDDPQTPFKLKTDFGEDEIKIVNECIELYEKNAKPL